MAEGNLVLDVIEDKPTPDNGQPVRLVTSRGEVACRFYTATETRYGAIWVGGRRRRLGYPGKPLISAFMR